MYAILRPETSPGVRQREDEVSGRGIKHFSEKFGHDQIIVFAPAKILLIDSYFLSRQ